MKVKKMQQDKRVKNVVEHIEIVTKFLFKINNKDSPINLTIVYEDYKNGENFLLYLMIEKFNPWDEYCKDYLDIESYVSNCITKIYPDIDNVDEHTEISKKMFDLISQILDDNEVVNLWDY